MSFTGERKGRLIVFEGIDGTSITGIIVFFVYASLRLLFKRVKECFSYPQYA